MSIVNLTNEKLENIEKYITKHDQPCIREFLTEIKNGKRFIDFYLNEENVFNCCYFKLNKKYTCKFTEFVTLENFYGHSFISSISDEGSVISWHFNHYELPNSKNYPIIMLRDNQCRHVYYVKRYKIR